MKPLAPLDFSHVIAFLLPGFVAVYALGYLSPRTGELISLSFSADAGIGPVFVLMVASLVLGVGLSALRTLALDRVQHWTGVTRPDLDFSQLKCEQTRAAFSEAVANTYRYAQFYGNTMLAVVCLALAKLYNDRSWAGQAGLYFALILGAVILFCAHRAQLKDTYRTSRQILSNRGPHGEESSKEEEEGRKEEEKGGKEEGDSAPEKKDPAW